MQYYYLPKITEEIQNQFEDDNVSLIEFKDGRPTWSQIAAQRILDSVPEEHRDPFRNYDAWKTTSPYDYESGEFEIPRCIHCGAFLPHSPQMVARHDWTETDYYVTGWDNYDNPICEEFTYLTSDTVYAWVCKRCGKLSTECVDYGR